MDDREPDLESLERLLGQLPLREPSARLDRRVAAALGKPGAWTGTDLEPLRAGAESATVADESSRPSPPQRHVGATSWFSRRRVVVAAAIGGAVAAALVLLLVGPWSRPDRQPAGPTNPIAANEGHAPAMPRQRQTAAVEPTGGAATPGMSVPPGPAVLPDEAVAAAGHPSPATPDPHDVAGPDWPERLGPPRLVFEPEPAEAEPIQIEQVWSTLAANNVVRTEASRPMQRVERQVHRRVQWIDPQRHVHIEWNIPSEQSAMVPLEFN